MHMRQSKMVDSEAENVENEDDSVVRKKETRNLVHGHILALKLMKMESQLKMGVWFVYTARNCDSA